MLFSYNGYVNQGVNMQTQKPKSHRLRKVLFGISLTIVILFVLIVSAFFFMATPRLSKRQELKAFTKNPIAHRGLFENKSGAEHCENSLASFQKAIDNNYIIELDVQITKDQKLVVHHDYNLYRACIDEYPDDEKIKNKTPIAEMTLAEIKKYHIFKTSQVVPTFDEVLDLVKGKTPILIEIKVEKKELEENTCKLTYEAMKKHPEATLCVQSFNPRALKWFRKNAPEVLRGQLSSNFMINKEAPKSARFILSNMLANFISRPDFYSYQYDIKKSFGYVASKGLFKVPTFAWTLRDEKDYKENLPKYDNLIFDSINPELIP